MAEPIRVLVADASRVGEARRVAAGLASQLGFDATGVGRVALVVTEAATNLVKHGEGGEVVLTPTRGGGPAGLEVLALDKGPGMVDPGRCLGDGYSTAGSPGNGLGAIRRIADEFDLFTADGQGTALLARLLVATGPKPSPTSMPRVGSICLPKAGETANGDAWSLAEHGGRWSILVADGLGHGPLASEASTEAIAQLAAHAAEGPVEALKAIHAALRSTRGAVAAIAEVDPERGSLRFAGLGNIAGSVVGPAGGQSLVSLPGTLGHEARKFQEFTYEWSSGATLVLHSDGLATQWRLDRYPGLIRRDPSLIAGVLYRDFCRGRDDVTVVVAREADPGDGR